MMEQYMSKSENRYDDDDDHMDRGYTNTRRGLDHLLALEEIVDNTLTYYVKNSDEATTLLKKCVRMMDDKQWTTMKSYLEGISKPLIFNSKLRI
jgi:hypothetical protein